jgi:hypothetical protein
MSTHTPGPWTVQGAFIGTDKVHIAQVKGAGPYITFQRAEANMRLIAAAPELRDALAAMLANCHDVERDPAVIDAVHKARQALALC